MSWIVTAKGTLLNVEKVELISIRHTEVVEPNYHWQVYAQLDASRNIEIARTKDVKGAKEIRILIGNAIFQGKNWDVNQWIREQ